MITYIKLLLGLLVTLLGFFTVTHDFRNKKGELKESAYWYCLIFVLLAGLGVVIDKWKSDLDEEEQRKNFTSVMLHTDTILSNTEIKLNEHLNRLSELSNAIETKQKKGLEVLDRITNVSNKNLSSINKASVGIDEMNLSLTSFKVEFFIKYKLSKPLNFCNEQVRGEMPVLALSYIGEYLTANAENLGFDVFTHYGFDKFYLDDKQPFTKILETNYVWAHFSETPNKRDHKNLNEHTKELIYDKAGATFTPYSYCLDDSSITYKGVVHFKTIENNGMNVTNLRDLFQKGYLNLHIIYPHSDYMLKGGCFANNLKNQPSEIIDTVAIENIELQKSYKVYYGKDCQLSKSFSNENVNLMYRDYGNAASYSFKLHWD